MTSKPWKIIVTGAVNGQFPAVFNKISALHAKNPFSFAIVAGDLFADPSHANSEDDKNITSLINGEIDIPLSVYFGLGASPLPERIVERLESNDDKVCANLSFLGKRTTLKTVEGVKIVALGGSLDREIIGLSKDKYPPFYNEEDAKALQGVKSVDLLITSQWPSRVRTGSDRELSGADPVQQSCVGDLCSAVRPKYHFSTTPSAFFEREPFFHEPAESEVKVYQTTRFISLASFGNSQKAKWVYAFTLDPRSAPSDTIPAGATPSPLTINYKKRVARGAFYGTWADPYFHSSVPSKRTRHAPPPKLSECYFCLSTNVSQHLITSIGESSYMTTSKGPLSTANTFSDLKFPGHMLIIPLAHAPTIATIAEVESRKATYEEMMLYWHALNSMLFEKSTGDLGSVTWEVSRKRGFHTHWQFIPVPADLIRDGTVERAFKTEAKSRKFPKFVKDDLGDGTKDTAPAEFFRVMLWAPSLVDPNWDGKEDENWPPPKEDLAEVLVEYPDVPDEELKETKMYLPLDDSFRFDLQFGREIVAKLLGLEKRKLWQDCGQTQAEEEQDARAFVEAFKEYKPASSMVVGT